MKDANECEPPPFTLRGLELAPPGLPINCQAESSAPTLQHCRANGGQVSRHLGMTGKSTANTLPNSIKMKREC